MIARSNFQKGEIVMKYINCHLMAGFVESCDFVDEILTLKIGEDAECYDDIESTVSFHVNRIAEDTFVFTRNYRSFIVKKAKHLSVAMDRYLYGMFAPESLLPAILVKHTSNLIDVIAETGITIGDEEDTIVMYDNLKFLITFLASSPEMQRTGFREKLIDAIIKRWHPIGSGEFIRSCIDSGHADWFDTRHREIMQYLNRKGFYDIQIE